jgi:two-component system, LytTR family, sensor histidine kinase AlgZ
MHPIFEKKVWLAAYLGVWLVLGVMLAGLIHFPGDVNWRDAIIVAEPLVVFFAFVCLTPWYMCRQMPLGSTNGFKLFANHLGAAVLANALWIQMARVIVRLLDLGDRFRTEATTVLAAMGFLLYSLSVALHYMLLAIERSREAEVQARDAELRALKAQINPHFLFNSLNSITALTATDPVRAREMCIRLSDFLRNTLGLGERESISWREELQLAKTYLEVEQVRFGARLHVEMDVDEACSECLVPPLVLQPLIENAVKHGIATMIEGGTIKVEGRVNKGLLEVSVENGFDPESPAPRRSGLGLRNVRNRLTTRFGDVAHLTAQSTENRFRAEMVVPCRRAD